MRAIGIDLGTTNSAAAIGGREVKVLPTRAGEQLTPSVVGFVRKRKSGDGEIVVGRQAVSNAARDPANTIFSVKRLMGRVYGEKWAVYGRQIDLDEVRTHFHYALADAPPADAEDQGIKVVLNGQPYSPVDVSALILKQVKADAEQALGESVTHAVITVPAYFHERQRSATARAGELAGLKVLKIIDEPTAAAIAFGTGKEAERHRVLVYDLGGGTFDISIIQMTGGQYQVLEIEGDNWLGGDDFDQTIIRRMIDWVKQEHDFDPSSDRGFLAKAKEEAQKAKIALSTQQSAEIFAPLLLKVPGGGPVDLEMVVTREQFEADVRPLVERTLGLVQTALKRQNLSPDDITEVLMVGGSTAVPLVQQAVAELFGRGKVKRHVNPMECVALGAGILAAGFDLGAERDGAATDGPGVVEVTALHLGIAAVKGNNPDAFVPIIPKGTPYPLTEPKRQIFYPAEENQTLIRVPVYEGLNERASLNEQQGIIEFPLPEGLTAQNAVEVSFNYDRNRVLTVGIRVLGTSHAVQETLRRDRARVAQADKTLLEDWREDLQPSVRAGKHFLEVYGEYMEEEDRAELREAITQGDQALEANNQVEGKRATLVLRNKIMGSGTASQLFIAERAMHNAPPELAQRLAEAVAQLREAHARGDQARVEQLSMALRMVVARLIADQRGRKEVEDRADLGHLLRVRE